MARKKTETTAAPPPPAAEKRTRQRQPAKRRALDALKTIELAVVGDDGCMIAAQNLGEMLARLPETWEPQPLTPRGPLQVGDWCEPVEKARALAPHNACSAPYRLTEKMERGRVTYCQIEDRDGATHPCLMSDLRRCAPPAEVPDVPAGDPAALGEPDDEPAVGDVVLP